MTRGAVQAGSAVSGQVLHWVLAQRTLGSGEGRFDAEWENRQVEGDTLVF